MGTREETETKVQEAPSTVASAGKNVKLELGRGLDVGTVNLASAVRDVEGNVSIKIQRNVFIEIDAQDFYKKMLTKLNVQYVVHNGHWLVVGDDAFELANILNQETRRPMKAGVISPQEVDALPIEKIILESLLGPPTEPNEKVYFSIPADPIDAEFNVVYHKGLFSSILKKMGYCPKPLLEGQAVVFAELEKDDFTGIGISCGGGMFNICVSYKGVPALSFSTSRAGDWIDRNVATVLGIKHARASAIKERGINILSPQNREEEAVEIYYRNLISYTLENIKHRFETSEGMPQFPDPVEIVCAGGTSLVGGFIEVFQQELKAIKFPIPVKNIRRADDALFSVAKGCLVASLADV
jgi:actin-like ATPase involved in cell morphogenesis